MILKYNSTFFYKFFKLLYKHQTKINYIFYITKKYYRVKIKQKINILTLNINRFLKNMKFNINKIKMIL